MSPLGWGTAAGAIGKIVDRFTDPVRKLENKMEALERERKKIVSKPASVSSSQRLSDIDSELRELQSKKERELNRK